LIFFSAYQSSLRKRATGICSCSRYFATVRRAILYDFSFNIPASFSSVRGLRLFSLSIQSWSIFLISRVESFLKEDRNGLKKTEEASKSFSKKAKKNKDKVYSIVQQLSESSVDTSHFYVQMMEHKREMAHALHFMLNPMIGHVENNHKPFTPEQNKELRDISDQTDTFFNFILHAVKEQNFEELDSMITKRDNIMANLHKFEKDQIERIKNKEVNTRNSQLFFKIISEMEHLLLHSVNLVKSQRDFITYTRQAK